MERMTRRDAEAAFRRLVEASGGRLAQSWDDVDGMALDYNACYGGYVVEQVISASGGITHPFGARRRPAREFVEACWFAMNVLAYHNELVRGEV